MKTTLLLLFALILTSGSLLGQEQKTYYTDAGDKITGIVIAETDSTVTLKTDFGTLVLDKTSIHTEQVRIRLKNGDIIVGELLSRNDKQIQLLTSLGPIEIDMDKIATLETKPGDQETPSAKETWYFSDEQLMDIWFDPTGFPLKHNEFYLSLLSWAFGFSDRFQVSSRWSNYFVGDLNIRPKYTLYQHNDAGQQSNLSIGGHFHLRGLPDKYEYKKYEVKQTQYWDDSTGQIVQKDTVFQEQSWVRIGDVRDKDGYYYSDFSSGNKVWFEVFAAYSRSKLKTSGQGRINFTIGGSAIFYPNSDPLPRFYVGADYDVLKNLKLISEVFWDPYYAPWINRSQSRDVALPVFFDIGFITNSLPVFGGNHYENFWIGIHFQQPFLSVYYKF